MKEPEENLGCLVESGKNPSKMFDFSEKTFDQVPFFVGVSIIGALKFGISSWRHNHAARFLCKAFNENSTFVTSVRNEDGV